MLLIFLAHWARALGVRDAGNDLDTPFGTTLRQLFEADALRFKAFISPKEGLRCLRRVKAYARLRKTRHTCLDGREV